MNDKHLPYEAHLIDGGYTMLPETPHNWVYLRFITKVDPPASYDVFYCSFCLRYRVVKTHNLVLEDLQNDS
jgi:hypothetical protein